MGAMKRGQPGPWPILLVASGLLLALLVGLRALTNLGTVRLSWAEGDW